jgi:hypothetical protein
MCTVLLPPGVNPIAVNKYMVEKIPIPYFLTQWSTVLLEKVTGFKLVKEFPAFYGTRRFITAFTSGCHLSLS